ncbi:MAG: flavin prenyltransferase UbiX [Porticoccaceae bacterium]|nr:MAG: flavin prenyltransferase UbiX [Porticoccaceae bacterium]
MAERDRAVTLAITGASGAAYGLRLLDCLVQAGWQVAFLVSAAGRVVVRTETELELPEEPGELEEFLTVNFDAEPGQIRAYGERDWFAPVASGSAAPPAMVICPASGGTIAAIARGLSGDLIERAADVVLKEKRRLIVVPRETPVSAIHLENQLALARLGATVLPASPGFYHGPRTVEDLVDFVVARILDQLGVEQRLVPRWGE